MTIEYEAKILAKRGAFYLIQIRHGDIDDGSYPANMVIVQTKIYLMSAPADLASFKTWLGIKVQALKDAEVAETLSPSIIGNTYSETDLSVV